MFFPIISDIFKTGTARTVYYILRGQTFFHHLLQMTVNGRGDTVCMGYETYNKLKAQIELLEAIALAEEDERKGRMGPIEDTFVSIEQLLSEAE